MTTVTRQEVMILVVVAVAVAAILIVAAVLIGYMEENYVHIVDSVMMGW